VEIHEHRSELGEWQTAQRPADPRLRAFVHGYFASSSHLRTAVQERHVARTEVPLLINLGAPHRRWHEGGSGEWISRDGAWVVGLHDRPQLTQAVGERSFLVVRFTPIGAHLFLGVPMHHIANQAVDLELLAPSLAHTIMNRIGSARSWAQRFSALESLIGERVAGSEVPAALCSIWSRLVGTDGRIAVGSLAAELDCSHRALIARFRTYAGFPPKTIARMLRFDGAVRSLERGTLGPYLEVEPARDPRVDAVPWTQIAARCGYSDQAHLIKDFRQFAGRTPAAFLRTVK
jgi:AraC-like DNA-binding protein